MRKARDARDYELEHQYALEGFAYGLAACSKDEETPELTGNARIIEACAHVRALVTKLPKADQLEIESRKIRALIATVP